MPKNEDGEFELVLGNKQLLSMFFVTVLLLGVFFVMGYIVGRGAVSATAPEIAAAKPESKPLVVDSPTPKLEPAPSTEPPPSRPVEKQVEKPVEKPPEKPAEKPVEKAPEPVKTAKAEAPKPEPPPEPKRPAKATAAPPETKASPNRPPTQSSQPVAGESYLQLVATTKHDADVAVEALRKAGFQALDSPVAEKPDLYRVLVGPVTGNVTKMKSDLQSKGFPGDKAFKKTF